MTQSSLQYVTRKVSKTMGSRTHVATQYLVNFEEYSHPDILEFDCWVWSMHEYAENHDLGDLVLWHDEHECNWDLAKDVLLELAKRLPKYSDICTDLVEMSPEYNDFVRVETY